MDPAQAYHSPFLIVVNRLAKLHSVPVKRKPQIHGGNFVKSLDF